jgi:hypothetical protein
VREAHRRLHFERFAHDVMPLHVFRRGNAHAGAGARPALEQPFESRAAATPRTPAENSCSVQRELASGDHLVRV